MIGKFLRMFNPRWPLLKQEIVHQHLGPFVEKNSAGYTITIICRGEQLLYRDDNGSLVLEISIYGQWLDAASIKKWDKGFGVSDAQRMMVIDRIKQYFEAYQGFHIKVVNSNENLE